MGCMWRHAEVLLLLPLVLLSKGEKNGYDMAAATGRSLEGVFWLSQMLEEINCGWEEDFGSLESVCGNGVC